MKLNLNEYMTITFIGRSRIIFEIGLKGNN